MPGPDDQAVEVNSDVTGGVGNGQATGTGQVSENFDMSRAVESISSDLGFKVEKSATAPGGSSEELVPPAGDTKTPEQTALEEKAAADAKAAEDAKAAAPAGAPKTWKPEAAAQWAQVPPAVQAEIARREEDMFRGLEQYKAAAGFGQSINNELKPYEQILKSAGIEPVPLIRNLLAAEHALATGTNESRIAFLRDLAGQYKIDLGQISGSGNGEADDLYADPQIVKLQQEIQELRSGQAAVQQRAQQEERAKATSQVEAFFADAKNVYADECANEIADLVAKDRTLTLQQAYDKAVWLNPVTREKEIARQTAEKQASAQAEAKARAEAALKAKGVNVQSSPKAGAATMPLGTMDDTMAETMREIKNRS